MPNTCAGPAVSSRACRDRRGESGNLRIVLNAALRTSGMRLPSALTAMAFAVIAALPFCAQAGEPAAGPQGAVDPIVAEQLLALDPARVGAREVAAVLARAPAPRIVLLQGSLAPITMEPFAAFLIAMGYPPERIRHPRDGRYSSESFIDSRQLAGALGWYYETEGVRPLVIGHSQGGMLAIRVLHELAGAFAESIPVWNPVTDAALPRTTIVDPLSGATRPVVGLRLPYAAAIATGKLPRILLGQWEMLAKLREIPDSAEEFTGFAIEWDLIAGLFPRSDPYLATGSAAVRNVILPASYTHIGLPATEHLAANPVTRAWIEAYTPDADVPLPDDAGVDATNLVHAADIWHSVKRHWTLEAQRLVAAQRRGAR
jgi:hypothetical protein